MKRAMISCFTALLILALAPMAKAEDAATRRTERTWRANCAICHGNDGKGATEMGKRLGLYDLSTAAWQKGTTNDKIRVAIETGKPGLKSGRMNGFRAAFKPDQIDDLVLFVRTLGH